MGTKLIKRFQTPFAPLRPEPYKLTQDWGTAMESSTGERFKRNVAEPAVQQAHSVTKPIVDQYTKAQKRNKQTSALQLALWNNGFFKGLKDRRGRDVTYETAVDGLKGSMTNQAIEAAKAAGYIINKDGSLTKMSDLTGDMVKNAPAPLSTRTSVRRTSTFPQDERAFAKAAQTFEQQEQPQHNGETLSYSYVKNLYPYGYSDNGGQKDTFGGVVSKIFGGFTGPSERKEHLDAIMDLDLNDPEQYKEAMKHRSYFDNFKNSDIRQIQASARLREDANRLYTGMPQKYNSFMVNPDFELPEAKALGVPTYTFTDPKLRAQYQSAGRSYNLAHGAGHHQVSDNQGTLFNRFTTTSNGNDGSGYYREKWDLLGVPGENIYIADTIPANARRGRAFAQNNDRTPTDIMGFIKALINNNQM